VGAGGSARIPIPHRGRVLVALGAGCAVVLAGVGLAAGVSDHPLGFFLHEPATAASDDPCSGGDCSYAGLLSNLGVLLLAAATVTSFLVAHLASPPGESALGSPFAWGGAVTGLLLLDEVFSIHDSGVPSILSATVPGLAPYAEELTFGLYAIPAVAFAVRFRGFLLRTDYPLLVAAVALLGASALVDPYVEDSLAEDGTKFVGLACWATYFVGTGLAYLGAALTSAPPPPARRHP
jgi:hypothetical protein